MLMLIDQFSYEVCSMKSTAVIFVPLLLSIGLASSVTQQSPESQRQSLINMIQASDTHEEDQVLIEANLQHLSVEQLTDIARFMSDTQEIADSRWFDVRQYTSWDDYNFHRLQGEVITSVLARRDLFLDAARQLNDPLLTNMSPHALAALAFAQAYVEEKWDQQPPWEGDASNHVFNWVHPTVLEPSDPQAFIYGDTIEKLRVEFWWATYFSYPLTIVHQSGLGKGSDFIETLRGMAPPESNAPRLAGYAYPIGNQLYLQTAETAYWYAAYREYGRIRYGSSAPSVVLDTRIAFPLPLTEGEIVAQDAVGIEVYPNLSMPSGLWALHTAPFARALRVELTQPETAAFWNTMRFVWAGARQREGGGTPESPQDGQPSLFALRYDMRSEDPNGRPTTEVSAFSLLTTVYSDSILLDFINWDASRNALIVPPTDTNRPDGIHRMVSERNKAIFVIEHLGDESTFANATHVSSSRGLGFSLVTAYQDPQTGDFLPYSVEEVRYLALALVTEASEFSIQASRQTLCNSPLLRLGYEYYAAQDTMPTATWAELVGNQCG